MKAEKNESELGKNIDFVVPILESGIGTRINAICDQVGSKKKLAKMVGLSESQLHRIIAGESEPKIGAVAAIAAAGGISIDYLVLGQGPVSPRPSAEVEADPDKIDIPILNVEVSAGHGAENGHESTLGSLAFQRQYLASRGLNAKSLRVVYAKGDSMEPEIQDGAAMLVNTADTRLDEGCIYVIRYDGHLFAKRVQRGFGGISLVSANKEYPPMEVKPEQLQEMRVLGRVVWSGREH